MPRPRPITSEQGAEIIIAYMAGESRNSLARRYGTSRHFITDYLLEKGARVRGIAEACMAKLPSGINPFLDAQNNPEAAYWVGFLMADGCISWPHKRRSPGVICVLQNRDSGHLEKLAAFIGLGKVRVSAREELLKPVRYYARWCVYERGIAESLISYGVTPRKGKTARVCDDLAGNVDFWRGVTDGDGNLRFRQRGNHKAAVLQIVGSEPMMCQFAAFAREHTGAKARVYFSKGTWCVALQARKAKRLVRLMYGHGGPSLDRKQLIANEMMAR